MSNDKQLRILMHAPTAGAPLTVLPEGAVLALARMQHEGWAYVRA